MSLTAELLLPNQFYHVYNRGNNGENLFYSEANYHYFLRQYAHYLSGYLDTYAYCLLPNHFHLLVRVKDAPDFEPLKGSSDQPKTPDQVVSEAFRRFFNGYAKAINRQESRRGSLFQKNFKRKRVTSEAYFTRLVYYIHANPQRHGIIADFRDYPHSSYSRMLLESPTKLHKQEVLEWFGSKPAYQQFHEHEQVAFKGMEGLLLED